ncbi:hypothetical protein [Saccharomonospora sp. NB11]|jgi:ABC-2 type transport system permease protein|uniref:hypothetical protein n=1 Tax=Saccharomonospora sp. NB11 TaxID=1642298 RepID=UPI0018D01687|nr:hypothetical protein [Saccharomonospora sp. NB11]
MPDGITLRRETSPAATLRALRGHLGPGYFLTSTVLLLAALVCVPLLYTSVSDTVGGTTVGLSGQAGAIADPLLRAAHDAGVDVDVVRYHDAELARADVERGTLDVLVSGSAANLRAITGADLDEVVRSLLTEISRAEVVTAKLAQAGADPATAYDDVLSVGVEVETVPETASPGERALVALAAITLLVVTLAGSGVVLRRELARGDVAPVGTVGPVWPLACAAGLAGALQLLLVGGTALIVAASIGAAPPLDLAVTTLVWSLVWFGLAWVSCAPVTVLLSQAERPAWVPAVLVVLAGLGSAMAVLPRPDDPTALVTSLLPPVAPFAVPSRIVTGAAGPLDVAAAITLALVTAALLARSVRRTALRGSA